MEQDNQQLPPAAVERWYELALVVFKGVTNPDEKQAWVAWAEDVVERRKLARSPAPRRGQAQRMGYFVDQMRPGRGNTWQT